MPRSPASAPHTDGGELLGFGELVLLAVLDLPLALDDERRGDGGGQPKEQDDADDAADDDCHLTPSNPLVSATGNVVHFFRTSFLSSRA